MAQKKQIGEIIAAALPILEKVSRLFFIGKRTRAAIRAIIAILTIVKEGLPPDDMDQATFAAVYGQITDVAKSRALLQNELEGFQRELQNDDHRANALS